MLCQRFPLLSPPHPRSTLPTPTLQLTYSGGGNKSWRLRRSCMHTASSRTSAKSINERRCSAGRSYWEGGWGEGASLSKSGPWRKEEGRGKKKERRKKILRNNGESADTERSSILLFLGFLPFPLLPLGHHIWLKSNAQQAGRQPGGTHLSILARGACRVTRGPGRGTEKGWATSVK